MDLLCLKLEMILRNMDLLNLTQILTVCRVPSAFPLGGASGTSNFYHSHNPWFLSILSDLHLTCITLTRKMKTPSEGGMLDKRDETAMSLK